MLDGDHVVVAVHPKRTQDILPYAVIMAVAHGAENPAPFRLGAIMTQIQHAVLGGIVCVDLCILGMKEINGFPKDTDGGHRVNPLPEQVAGVKIGA
ncbi:hypothetical protein SDC9_203586 [bioreactor metagenome]|uniref:Uncharacterized protein n=1 Tax=bioreactor metagenome TaxID=1076179 RepID=A0A645IYG5_9ZZZZ